MSDSAPPAKRMKFDLQNTCDVLVGKGDAQKRFTIYTDVLTDRSEFFRAARSAQWLTDPAKPVDLEDEDPEVFQLHLNCVYFGVEAIRVTIEKIEGEHSAVGAGPQVLEDAFEKSEAECERLVEESDKDSIGRREAIDHQFERLIRLYLIADKLKDPDNANLITDELARFGDLTRSNPGAEAVTLAYGSTVHGNLVRKLLRDSYLHEQATEDYLQLQAWKYPGDFYRDIVVEYTRIKHGNSEETVEDLYHCLILEEKCAADKCYYHQHDDKHPRCVPKPVPGQEKWDDESESSVVSEFT